MATTTTNLGLIKPAGTDKIRIANINQNMDTLDEKIGPVGNTSLQAQATAHANTLSAMESGIAILANGNTHAAISSGDFVYVKNHGTLAEGMYIATAAIAANGTLSTSNLSSASSGGLNALQSSTNQAITNINIKAFKGNSTPEANVNCDTLEEGLHFISTGAVNGPGVNWFYVDVRNYVSGAKSQIARTLTNRTFSRMHNGQAWTEWQEHALKSNLSYKDYTFSNLEFTADVVGTRGLQQQINLTSDITTYGTPVAISIVSILDSGKCIFQAFLTGSTLYLNGYRASANSMSGNSVVVRVAFRTA